MTSYLLSTIEMVILRWLSRGRTISEIAALEGKGVPEIENCLSNALVRGALGMAVLNDGRYNC